MPGDNLSQHHINFGYNIDVNNMNEIGLCSDFTAPDHSFMDFHSRNMSRRFFWKLYIICALKCYIIELITFTTTIPNLHATKNVFLK